MKPKTNVNDVLGFTLKLILSTRTLIKHVLVAICLNGNFMLLAMRCLIKHLKNEKFQILEVTFNCFSHNCNGFFVFLFPTVTKFLFIHLDCFMDDANLRYWFCCVHPC